MTVQRRPDPGSAARLAALVIVAAGLTVVLSIRLAGAQNPERLNAPAPELVGDTWLNTPRREPVRLASRRGKVTLVEFWTFG